MVGGSALCTASPMFNGVHHVSFELAGMDSTDPMAMACFGVATASCTAPLFSLGCTAIDVLTTASTSLYLHQQSAR
eukprot:COSAG01_NODE_175_length_22996_cov_18.857892_16_plen_76_part_00